jgi:hypothetical protein
VGLGNGSGDASDEVERENWEFKLSGSVMIRI